MRLLYEDLPLRSTKDLGNYADDVVLAHIFGDLTRARFPLARLSATRGHAADHPMEITGAGTGTTPTASYAAKVEADVTGRTCTFVDFGAPVPVGTQMWAYGRGVRNAATGALVTNPADVMEYICALAGRTDTFQQLREESAAAGLALAGRLAVMQSIRLHLDAVAGSCGAIWCPGMGRRYPAGGVSGYVLELTAETTGIGTVEEVSDDTADILHLAYDQCDVTGKPQKSMRLEASPMRFGGIVKELSLPLLRTPANAEQVGRPILQRMAGRRYNVPLDSSQIQIRPGVWVRLVGHPDWSTADVDPAIMPLAVDVNRDDVTTHVAGEFQATYPTVTVTAHSLALSDLSGARIEISERNGIATITVFDADNHGVPGARVSLNGSAPKTTDAAGQVSFAYVPGEYELIVQAPGFAPATLQITL